MMPIDDREVKTDGPTTLSFQQGKHWTWFRFYEEFLYDPKVQEMSEANQRRLVMIFCLRAREVLRTLTESEIARALNVSTKSLRHSKRVFIDKGFIDEDWNVIHWEKRQYLESESAKRTREYRDRLRHNDRHGDVTVTSPVSHSNVTPHRGDVTETSLAGARSDSEYREQREENSNPNPAQATVLDTALDPGSVERPALRDTHACEGEPTTQESPRRLKATDYDGVNYAQAKIEAHRAEANGKA